MENKITTDPPQTKVKYDPMVNDKLNIIQKHPAFFYFMFTYIISWGSAIAIVGLDGIPGTTDEQEKYLNAFIFALLFGPIIAGISVTYLVYGKTGLKEYYKNRLIWRLAPSNSFVGLK